MTVVISAAEASIRWALRPTDLENGHHSPNDPMSDLIRGLLSTIDRLRLEKFDAAEAHRKGLPF